MTPWACAVQTVNPNTDVVQQLHFELRINLVLKAFFEGYFQRSDGNVNASLTSLL